ncbi:MAG: rod shape-determining protein MreD [Planctomycetota bacterium]
MRWIAFSIVVYVVTVLQTAVVPFLGVHHTQPDLLIILAVYYALTARAQDALLAAWCIGLAADLTGLGFARHGGVGLHAFTLGLIAILIVNTRDFTFRDSVITRLVYTLLAAFLQSMIVGLHLYYTAANRPALIDVVQGSLYSAVFTALLAPYGHWVLGRMRHMLGLGTVGRVRLG